LSCHFFISRLNSRIASRLVIYTYVRVTRYPATISDTTQYPCMFFVAVIDRYLQVNRWYYLYMPVVGHRAVQNWAARMRPLADLAPASKRRTGNILSFGQSLLAQAGRVSWYFSLLCSYVFSVYLIVHEQGYWLIACPAGTRLRQSHILIVFPYCLKTVPMLLTITW